MLSASAQVTISGRRIKVNGADYRINGICYNPVAIGSSGGFDFSKIDQDIFLMKGANINTIRTYSPIANTGVLDKFAANGIKVIIGFGYNTNGNYDILSGTFVNYINAYKNHPAILMWELGNEYNYHPEWFGNNVANWYTALNNAASTARANDTSHPVSTAHGELPNAQARNACPNVQVWGMNVYRWDNPGMIYNDWAAVSTKPMYLSEAGADSFDKRIPAEDRNAQATAVTNIVNNVRSNDTVCSGVTVFEFNDEWWKAGSPAVQNTGGSAPNSSSVPYDGSADEEYWGIVDIHRNIKPAYTALKNAYAQTGGCTPSAINPYLSVNGGAWQNTFSATLAAGGSFQLAPHPLNVGTWSWTGPNGFTANTRNFTRSNVTTSMSGNYVASYTNTCGAVTTRTFAITVTGGGILNQTIEAESYASMSGVIKETCSEGGQNVGSFDAGDWTSYAVTIPVAGTYKVTYRVASIHTGRTLRLERANGTVQLGTIAIPNTGGWQTWMSVSHNVSLPAGAYSIGIATATGGFNINRFQITNNLSARSHTEEGIEMELVREEEREFFLSPNPAKDQLFIRDHENVKFVKIYSIQGREIISVERPRSSISVESLNPGLHICVIKRLNNSIKKEKIMKE
jgi:hypothetical protein